MLRLAPDGLGRAPRPVRASSAPRPYPRGLHSTGSLKWQFRHRPPHEGTQDWPAERRVGATTAHACAPSMLGPCDSQDGYSQGCCSWRATRSKRNPARRRASWRSATSARACARTTPSVLGSALNVANTHAVLRRTSGTQRSRSAATSRHRTRGHQPSNSTRSCRRRKHRWSFGVEGRWCTRCRSSEATSILAPVARASPGPRTPSSLQATAARPLGHHRTVSP